MKVLAPKYYFDFVCIADKCTHSCCIGWEIDIDADTYEKYRNTDIPYLKDTYSYVSTGDEPHFILTEDERCPHLNECGLCKIILNAGEKYLCDICRQHPRFYNYTNLGKEIGLGMACEEACRLILDSDEYDVLIGIDDFDAEIVASDYDATVDRAVLFKILKDDSISFNEKITRLCNQFAISVDIVRDRAVMQDLEYLYEADKSLLTRPCIIEVDLSLAPKLERILAYFVYRHCSESITLDDFRNSLCFCVFSTLVIGALSVPSNINDIARTYSEEIEYCEENVEKIKSIYM